MKKLNFSSLRPGWVANLTALAFVVGFWSGMKWEGWRQHNLELKDMAVFDYEVPHTHQWDQWEAGSWRTDGSAIQLRHCRTCGLGQMHELEKVK